MYSKFPEKSLKTLITDLLSNENENINEIVEAIFNDLCKNNCYYEYIKLLLDSGKINPTNNNNWLFDHAIKNGHTEIVLLLLSTGKVNITADNNWAIRIASEKGHLEVVKILLSTGKVDVTAQDNWAIRYASYNGHSEVVQLLLSTEKIDVTAEDNWAIRYASINGHSEIVRLLLSTGKINIANIIDIKILYIWKQMKSKPIDVHEIPQMMKTNGISKIVTKDKIFVLTTKINTNTDIEPSQIMKLMNDFGIIECEYDNQTSNFEYKIRTQIITSDENY